jgi:hypothetical protein
MQLGATLTLGLTAKFSGLAQEVDGILSVPGPSGSKQLRPDTAYILEFEALETRRDVLDASQGG